MAFEGFELSQISVPDPAGPVSLRVRLVSLIYVDQLLVGQAAYVGGLVEAGTGEPVG